MSKRRPIEVQILNYMTHKREKGETAKRVDCAHPLVLNNGVPTSWASSIMSMFGEAT